MPFPVLDGGHLVMIIIEAIIKREIPIKIKMAITEYRTCSAITFDGIYNL
ncbi:MAG: hypothetical protein MZV64_52255 [Ignavibacteriales bacterium]|nr:hypothetical protein [Ignavibacteriales bacterium]